MTFKDFENYCLQYNPFINETGILVNNYSFLKTGQICIRISNYTGTNPHSFWIQIAEKRTPKQMCDFLKVVM